MAKGKDELNDKEAKQAQIDALTRVGRLLGRFSCLAAGHQALCVRALALCPCLKKLLSQPCRT